MRAAARVATLLAVILAAAMPAHAAGQYTVVRHDTLYSIARRFGVPLPLLAHVNSLSDPTKIRVGQVLVIPGAGGPPRALGGPVPPSRSVAIGRSMPAAAPTARAVPRPDIPQRSVPEMAPGAPLGASHVATAAAAQRDAGAGVYVVRPGDTLYSLARTHGLSVAALQTANHLASPDLLRVGQALRVPIAPHEVTPARAQPPVLGVGLPPAPPGRLSPASPAGLSPASPAGLSPASPAGLSPASPAGPTPTGPGLPGLRGGPGRASGSAPPPVRPSPARAAVLARRVTAEALRYLGTPYVWGGTSRSGVDCSGLVYAVYASYVPHLPRLSYDQWEAGVPVGRNDLASGDLVFFNTEGRGASHVGIYLGDGRFVHPSSSARRVVIDLLGEPYYAVHYLGARRVL